MSVLRRRVIVTNSDTGKTVYNGLEFVKDEKAFSESIRSRGASAGQRLTVEIRSSASW